MGNSTKANADNTWEEAGNIRFMSCYAYNKF